MVNLKDYQRDAVKRLRTGSILCGGVGSGKSRTAIAYFFEKHRDKKLYVITTARKRDTKDWEDELSPFDISAEKIDSWNNIKKYEAVEGAFFIFDEQRVVGWGAWTRSFLKITRKNDWILLSATPGDVWMDYVPVFVANGYFRNKTDFCNQHVVWSRFSKFPQVRCYMNEGRLLKYRNDILVDMDFQRPTESHHEDVAVDYDSTLYRVAQKRRWNVFEDRPIENISELCMVLRRIVNSDKSRAVAVRELVGKHDRVIIFYRYNFELDILRSVMGGLGIAYAEWNGQKHELIPEGERWAYLVQYNSGNEGWNCTETDTMIFYSDDYSYKIMTQAAGRIDRMNTPHHDLYYYHLRSNAPIDKAIARALKSKKNFNERRFVERRSV